MCCSHTAASTATIASVSFLVGRQFCSVAWKLLM